MKTIIVVLFTAAIFCAFLANITLNKDKSKFVTAVTILTSLGGFALYGYGFAYIYDNIFLAILRATTATLSMFLGKNEFSAICSAPLLQSLAGEALFWIVHMMAIFVVANAVLITIGAKTIQYIRGLLVRRGNLSIIYGVNANSIALGRDLRKDKKMAIVFVDKKIDSSFSATITNNLEAVFLTDTYAVNASEKFLDKIGAFIKDRSITVYAMHENPDENIAFTAALKDTLSCCKRIPKKYISITLFTNMDLFYTKNLQAQDNEEFGFGCVMTMDRAYLVSRVLVQNYPPCNFIHFDTEKGVASEDFHAVILGFGKLGQAILKNILMNSQFEGSHFKAAIYDPQNDQISGFLHSNNSPMFTKYDITAFCENAKANSFYQYLQDNLNTIKYIVICTGNDKQNDEIATEIQSILYKRHSNIALFKCSYNGVVYQNLNRMALEPLSLYKRENLDIRIADKKAMLINHVYCGNQPDSDALEEWIHNNYFSKMSCRAAADFNPAYLRMVGKNAKVAMEPEGWNLTNEQLTNLGKTEHLRWCAFHYAMGFDTMPEEVFRQRIANYQKEKALNPNTTYAIQKDIEQYWHACLVDWDDLDALSEIYSEVTGKEKDYKRDDINNVLELPNLLRTIYS